MLDESPIRLLIVDDQQSIRRLCATIARGVGLECLQAGDAGEALERMEQDVPELVLADLAMGKMSGLELLAEVKRRSPLSEVALMSAYGTIESAVDAMRLGAYDFVVKPFRVDKLKLTLLRMMEKVRLVRENELLKGHLRSRTQPGFAPPVPCTDLEELERYTVQQVFEQVKGDKVKAQKMLGISRATLYRKIKQYGIAALPTRKKVQGSKAGERRAERLVPMSQS